MVTVWLLKLQFSIVLAQEALFWRESFIISDNQHNLKHYVQ